MTKPAPWKIFLYTAALFVAGVVCGAAILYHLRPPPPKQVLSLGRSDEIAMLIRDRLKTALDLTPEQLAKFDPLIKKASVEIEDSHRVCLDKIVAGLDVLHGQMCADLTPAQKEKLRALEAQRSDSMYQQDRYRPTDTNIAVTNQ